MSRSTLICGLALLCALGADAATTRFMGYTFRATVTTRHDRAITEYRRGSRPTLYVNQGQEYSVVVHNPLPVRVGVALTIDGLNSIDGKRTRPSDASKWVIEPNSSITIRGWQTGGDQLRRFVFTRQKESYAEWKEGQDKADYTRNLGVIGVAWFWSSEELQNVLNPPRPFAYRDDDEAVAPSVRSQSPAAAGCAKAAPEAEARKRSDSRAGTGMGHQERNDVTRVEFDFDTGMYSGNDCLAIYYEFARPLPQPKPFMDDDDDDNNEGFAPDMHSSSTTRPHWWHW